MKVFNLEITNQVIYGLIGVLALVALFSMINIIDGVEVALKRDHHNAEVTVGGNTYRVLNESKTDRYSVFGYNVDVSKE